MRPQFISASILALALCVSGFAQTTKTKGDSSASAQVVKELVNKIASSDPAVRAAAVEELRKQATKPGGIMVGPLSQQYLPALLKARLNQEAADFAMQAILVGQQDPGSLERLHVSRIRALLALNRPDEALAEAKSLYNVCSMKGTGDALLLVAECMQAVHPEDKAVAERFKREQVAGSVSSPQAGETTQPSTQPNSGEPNMLKAIKINAEPYLEAANKQSLSKDSYPNLLRRGNLLLEADQLAQAKQCFEAAYPLASEKERNRSANRIVHLTMPRARAA